MFTSGKLRVDCNHGVELADVLVSGLELHWCSQFMFCAKSSARTGYSPIQSLGLGSHFPSCRLSVVSLFVRRREQITCPKMLATLKGGAVYSYAVAEEKPEGSVGALAFLAISCAVSLPI